MPSSISNIGDAVSHELSKMLLKLDPLLGGVPLTITKLKIPETSVSIFEDQPHLHLDVTCDLLLFAPQIGHMVHGVVNNVAEDSVGLLILDTFNATIPHTQVSFAHA
jgi:DNA-directed RNA polymerase subunit E'/Rpb7